MRRTLASLLFTCLTDYLVICTNHHVELYNIGPNPHTPAVRVHMAVRKAVAYLGIGRDNRRYVPCDDSYWMVPSLLERAIRQDEAQGRKPIAVVASAGTVNT